jgi:predicted dehydrogenase
MDVVRVGVIGYGYWGPNLVRNFSEVSGSRVVAVSDLSPARLAQAQARYPAVRVVQDAASITDDPEIDLVVVATPASTHFELAMRALEQGKHVLVEKPIAETTEQARRLIATAERLKRVLMVDHTFVYTGAVRKMQELVSSGHLGRIYYYDAVRVNLGLFQQDVSVLWDLAVHDLSIMDYVLGARPHAVAALGAAHVPGQPVNTAYLTCLFENNLIAHLHVNWLAPLKIRQTLIGGEKQMIVYNDVEPSEKIKVYDKGVETMDPVQARVSYRAGDVWVPSLDATEGLRVEAEHLLECIREGRQPLTDGRAGLRVVRILEAATRSLGQGGRPVGLIWDDED